MGWVLVAGGLATIKAVHHASSSSSPSPSPRPSHGINGSPPRKQPSVAEVQRAIGVADDPVRQSGRNPTTTSSSFMDLLASTPIGQAESPIERKLRETAEWVVDRTENHASSGQRILMIVCLNILPVWLMLLLVASGLMKLPFNLPFMDDLLA